MAREYVVLAAGPMGAGKTTAIAALSEIPVVSTDAVNTDLARNAKATTTVALDYGEITLGDGDKVRLYGVPGQERFEFMWRILAKGMGGYVVLVDTSRQFSVDDAKLILRRFREISPGTPYVVGVSRRTGKGDPDKLARFVSFVNAPEAPDPTIEFTESDGRKVPVLLGSPAMPARA